MARHRHSPRLRRKMQQRTITVGVTWYSEDQWSLVRAAATDPERFEETYAEWVAMAEEAMQNLVAAGVVAERVHIVASDLLAWCLAHGKKNDAAARAEYVSQVR